MTAWLVAAFWIGGMGAAYKMNRARGVGLVVSALEALAWPAGLAHGLCLRFYVNSDWKDTCR